MLTSDMNAYYAYIVSLRNKSLMQYFAALRELSQNHASFSTFASLNHGNIAQIGAKAKLLGALIWNFQKIKVSIN